MPWASFSLFDLVLDKNFFGLTPGKSNESSKQQPTKWIHTAASKKSNKNSLFILEKNIVWIITKILMNTIINSYFLICVWKSCQLQKGESSHCLNELNVCIRLMNIYTFYYYQFIIYRSSNKLDIQDLHTDNTGTIFSLGAFRCYRGISYSYSY